MAQGRLAGRRALVTGAGSGIGAATVALFVEAGARVLAVDLPASNLAAVAGLPGVTAMEQDVATDSAPQTLASAAGQHLGGLDILVNNAGVASSVLVEALPDAEWDRVVGVNLRAPFRLARALIPALKQSPAGRIINLASVMAEGTDYGLAAYCAAKAGVGGLTRTLALELGKFGITANYVLPGAIRTGMTQSTFDQDEIAAIWAKKAALRRLGEPEDVARAILFLASDDARFVTGHGLNADGGLMLRV